MLDLASNIVSALHPHGFDAINRDEVGGLGCIVPNGKSSVSLKSR